MQVNNIRLNKPEVIAWSVHLITASGVIWGLLAIISIIQHDWLQAFVWMVTAVFIDGVDGTLARRFKVKGLTPGFDGALLDNIVDYQNYVLVPALFLYEAGLLPGSVMVIGLAAVLLSSAYQFCQTDAKTDDHTFKGFPSYWNIAVFYFFFLDMPEWLIFIFIIVLAILVFVPVKYIYPSRMAQYRRVTLAATAVWAVIWAIILLQYPNPSPVLLWLSTLYLFYYVGLSLYLMVRN